MRPTRAAALLCCAVALGCAPRAAAKKPEAAPADPGGVVRRLLGRCYSAVERGEVDELVASLHANVVAFGPSAADTVLGRERLADELRRRLMPLALNGGRLRLTGSTPQIGVAPGEKSAWVWDLPRVEVVREGQRPAAYPIRLTAHAIESPSGWSFDAVHLSVGISDEELFKPTALRSLGLAAEVTQELGPGTAPLVGLLRRVLKDQATKLERTSDREAVVIIGTGPSELFEGGRKFKEWGRAMLPQLRTAVVKLRVDGPMIARLAPGGASGFIATNLSLTLGAGRKAQTLPPFRSLWVFVKDGGGWSIVEDHESAGVPPSMWTPEGPLPPTPAADAVFRPHAPPRQEPRCAALRHRGATTERDFWSPDPP